METRRTYRIETTPITVRPDSDGGTVTDMGSLNFRVVDVYTDMPIGSVLHVTDGPGPIAYHAYSHFFKSGTDDNRIKPPSDGWGPRFDLAAKALWKDYNRRLPGYVRAIRWMWRWQPQGWAFVMLALGAFLTFLFQSGANSDEHTHAPAQVAEAHAPTPSNSAHSERGPAPVESTPAPETDVPPQPKRSEGLP